MNGSLITSAYVFLVVFAFLSAITIAIRSLARRGITSTSAKSRVATESFPDNAPAWPEARKEERLAPPPPPRDNQEYYHAADYVLDRNSPYLIPLPPRREESEW